MPAMDGYELVRRLRIAPETARTPVIFLTAEYDEADATELARAAGVTKVLRKPCKPADVLEAVDRALGEVPQPDSSAITGSYGVRHLRLMTDKLTQQGEELRAANARLALHAQAARSRKWPSASARPNSSSISIACTRCSAP